MESREDCLREAPEYDRLIPAMHNLSLWHASYHNRML
jgi:hypothetical protein